MSRQYNIKWKQSDYMEIERRVRNFNRKIERWRDDPDVGDLLPEKINAAEIRAQIDKMLNKESGLLGLSDNLSNDMRTLIEASEKGNEDATLAIEVFCYRLAKSLAALSCGLPRLDGLIFTGGIGENSAYIREKTMSYLPHFGFNLSKEQNSGLKRGTEGRIDAGTGPQIWVIPTDEEGRIADRKSVV